MRRSARPGATARSRVAAMLAALLPVAVITAASPAGADTGGGALFHVETTVSGVLVTSTQQPALSVVTAGLVDSAVAYTASTLDASGGSRARAAAYFPGDLVVQGPSLLCQLSGGCPANPPSYPLLADASYPTHPHDHAGAVQPVGDGTPVRAVAGSADATAQPQSTDAQTQATSVQALTGTPAAVTVGASTASSAASMRGDGVHVRVESLLHDVSIAGVLRVRTVHVVDDVVVRPNAKPTDRPTVELAGVSFAGQSASIDSSGVHVAGHNGPSPARQLSRQGVTVTLLGADRADGTGAARSDARGLMVTFALPVNGVPYVPNPVPCPDGFPFCVGGVNVNATYVGTLTLGSAGVAVDAEPPLGLGGLLAPPLTPGAAAGGSGQGPRLAPGAGAAAGSAQQPPPRGAMPLVAKPVAPAPRGALAGLSRVPLGALYAVLALVTVTLFVGWRATMTLASGRRR